MVFVVLAVIGTGYMYLRSLDFLRGPILILGSIQNGSTVGNSLVAVSGSVENIAFLTLNGRQIFTNEEGSFLEKLLLAPGYNIITLEAKDRFGRVKTERLELVYEPEIIN